MKFIKILLSSIVAVAAAISITASASAVDMCETSTAQNTNYDISVDTYDLTNAVISLDQETFDYTGKAVEPAVTVAVDDKELSQDSDYTVTYSNNINIGTGTVTVTGIGSYSGSATCNFTIKAPVLDKVKKVYSRSTQTAVRIIVNEIDCDGYMVYISYDGKFNMSDSRLYTTYSSKATTVRFDNLAHKSGTYYVKTMGYKKIGDITVYSEPVIQTVKLAPTPQKVGISSAQTETDSLDISLSKGDGKNSGYKVWVCSNKNFESKDTRFYKTYSGNDVSVTADYLRHPSTTYYVKTQAYRWYDDADVTGGEGLYIYSEPVVTAINLAPTLSSVKPSFANTTQTAVRIIVNQTEADGYKVWICYDKNFSASSSRLYKTYKKQCYNRQI